MAGDVKDVTVHRDSILSDRFRLPQLATISSSR